MSISGKHVHIGVLVITSTDGEIISVLVSNAINGFSLGSKIVVITSDGRSNRAICKAILKSNFDNTGVFDLKKTVFVMD